MASLKTANHSNYLDEKQEGQLNWETSDVTRLFNICRDQGTHFVRFCCFVFFLKDSHTDIHMKVATLPLLKILITY